MPVHVLKTPTCLQFIPEARLANILIFILMFLFIPKLILKTILLIIWLQESAEYPQ